MQLPEGTLLKHGEYRIVRVLGQGGFGITYEAEQVNLGRKVALKEFFMKDCCERDSGTSIVSVPTSSNRELVEKFKGKFLKEARMIASLEHPNIVGIHDVFEDNGTAYYVMDNLTGGSLSDLVKRNGPLPEARAEAYIRQIADALSYIHARNLVHLDVKPSNILRNSKGDAVLIDFGISKHYDKSGEQTSSTPVGVSKGFAPLEQGRDGDVSQFKPSTDIYSLGATLYNLVTGEIPPEASLVNEEGVPRHEGMSARIRSVIEKSMQPIRKNRPQSIDEFLALFDVPAEVVGAATAVGTAPAEKPAVVVVSPPVVVEEVKADESTVIEGGPLARKAELPDAGMADEAQHGARKSEESMPESGGYARLPFLTKGWLRNFWNDPERLPLLTIIYLCVGMVVGAVIIVLMIGAIIDECSDDERLLFICALIGSIIGEAGVSLMLGKKQLGFWLLAIGTFLFVGSFLFFVPLSTALIVLLLAVLFMVFAYGMMQVRNRHHVTAWSLMAPVPRKYKFKKLF